MCLNTFENSAQAFDELMSMIRTASMRARGGSAPKRQGPGQHEFRFEHRPAANDHAVKGCPHPSDHRMSEPMLHASDGLPSVALEPIPVESLGCQTELDDEVA